MKAKSTTSRNKKSILVQDENPISKARLLLKRKGLSPKPVDRPDDTRPPHHGISKMLTTSLNLRDDVRISNSPTISVGGTANNSGTIVRISAAEQTPGKTKVARSPVSILSASVSRSSKSSPQKNSLPPPSSPSKSKKSSRSSTMSAGSPQKKTLNHYLPVRSENVNVIPVKLTAELLKFHEENNTATVGVEEEIAEANNMAVEPLPECGDNVSVLEYLNYTFGGISANTIVLSKDFNDMYVFMQTQFGDRFITYFNHDIAFNNDVVKEFAHVPTYIASSQILDDEERAIEIGFYELAYKSGNFAGHIRPEIFSTTTSKGALIGTVVVEIGDDSPLKMCAVSYCGDKNVFTALTCDEESENRSIIAYPLVTAEAFVNGPAYITHAVHSVSSLINNRCLVEAKSEIENALIRFRTEITDNVNFLICKMEESVLVCERGEAELSRCMSETATVNDSNSYSALSEIFKLHRVYGSRIGDIAMSMAINFNLRANEFVQMLKQNRAELYVDSRRVLSPDTAMQFLSAESWKYPSSLDYAVLEKRNGKILGDDGNVINLEKFPELLNALD